MIEIDTLLVGARIAVRDLVPLVLTPVDAAVLIGEVQRLRDDADLLRTGREVTRTYADRVESELTRMERESTEVNDLFSKLTGKLARSQAAKEVLRKRIKALERILADADDLAATSERHAVVVWLYALEYGLALEGNAAAASIRAAAELIERGDHLTGDGSPAPKPPQNDPSKTPSGP